MDAIKMLKDDHRQIRTIFAQIDELTQQAAAARGGLMAEILPALSLQAALEQPRILEPLQASGTVDGSTSAVLREAIQAIRADWLKVEALFEAYEAVDQEAIEAIVPLTQELLATLTLHGAIEHAVFYPALQRVSSAATLDAIEEHHLVAILIDELGELSMTNAHFEPKLRLLKTLVEQHIREEEKGLLRLAREAFSADELEALGVEMGALRDQLVSQVPDVRITMIADALEQAAAHGLDEA